MPADWIIPLGHCGWQPSKIVPNTPSLLAFTPLQDSLPLYQCLTSNKQKNAKVMGRLGFQRMWVSSCWHSHCLPPASYNEGIHFLLFMLERLKWQLTGSSQHTAKNWGVRSNNPQGTRSCQPPCNWAWKQILPQSSFWWQCSLANMSIATLWDPVQRTQLSHTQTPDPEKCEITNIHCYKPLNLW